MSPKELLEIIAALKEAGVTHFKHGDIEINLSGNEKASVNVLRLPIESNHKPELKSVSLKEIPKEPVDEVPHVVQEMQTIFKMSDEQLLDRIMPIPKENEEP